MDQSIWELMNHGGGAMWVVISFSVIALAVGIERALAQWKFVTRARALGDTVTRCLSRGALDEGRSACERSPSPIADVFLVGYERLSRAKPEHVATAVHRERLRVNQDLRSRLWMLGTIGATAPFVGLFGTVVGIMMAFQKITKSGNASLDSVGQPIAEALLATAIGLVAAIPAVMAYNYFVRRIRVLRSEMETFEQDYLNIIKRHFLH